MSAVPSPLVTRSTIELNTAGTVLDNNVGSVTSLERESPLLQILDDRIRSASTVEEVAELTAIRQGALGHEVQATFAFSALQSHDRNVSAELASRGRRDRYTEIGLAVVFVVGVIFAILGLAIVNWSAQAFALTLLAAMFLTGPLIHYLNPEWTKLFLDRVESLFDKGN